MAATATSGFIMTRGHRTSEGVSRCAETVEMMVDFRTIFKSGSSSHVVSLGIVIHIILLISVFDIYFQSPVLHDIPPVSPPSPAPASRLVLFVADGLRADKCFGSKTNEGKWAAPYLRSIVETQGVWGISFTRVPTESRPGHVALIAGFYEDVSAVTKGWKENPVEFDSVFNRSRFTWSWGSPDILPMFAKGASGYRVFMHSYTAEEENFADSNPSRLDDWVFDHFQEFLDDVMRNSTLYSMVNQNKVVFFLHLLGLDTMGHSRKPWSKEYVEAISVMDNGIQRTVSAIENFYNNDGKTAYIFTADHGMTDWGSHGSSDPEETNTPFVAWGAGIRKPKLVAVPTTSSWQLEHILPINIQQADVAPLMSTLVGIPLPVNSVGVLPIDVLSGEDEYKSQCLMSNAQQIGKQFEKHWELKELHSLPFLFRPFSKLTLDAFQENLVDILQSIAAKQHSNALNATEELISLLLEGIHYFQTYSRIPLSICIVFGFIGWMIYLVCLLHENEHLASPAAVLNAPTEPELAISRKLSPMPFVVLAILIALVSYVKQDPVTYYLYYLLPVFTWYLVAQRKRVLISVLTCPQQHPIRTLRDFMILFIAIELLVLVFLFREVLSLGLVFMAFWPFTYSLKNQNKMCLILWVISCWGLSIFPLLPPVGKNTNYTTVTAAGIVAVVMTVIYFYRFQLCDNREPKSTKVISMIQISLLMTSICNVWLVSSLIEKNASVSGIHHIISWGILASSQILPLFGSSFVHHRLFHVLTSLVTSFILFSSTYEVFMFIQLISLLLLWLMLENSIQNRGYQITDLSFHEKSDNITKSYSTEDIRRAYFSLFMLTTAYFALGNIANVNSFSPSSVYCFVTVFSPFLMGVLLICKILLPFVAVATVLKAIQVALHQPPMRLFWSILLLCDIMVVNFFFLVRDEGSWLEIGSSIGRFVIVMATTIAFIILYALATFLTNTSFVKLMSVENKVHYS